MRIALVLTALALLLLGCNAGNLFFVWVEQNGSTGAAQLADADGNPVASGGIVINFGEVTDGGTNLSPPAESSEDGSVDSSGTTSQPESQPETSTDPTPGDSSD